MTIPLAPTFVHLDPALTAAFTEVRARDKKSESIVKKAMSLFFSPVENKLYILLLQGVFAYIHPILFKL